MPETRTYAGQLIAILRGLAVLNETVIQSLLIPITTAESSTDNIHKNNEAFYKQACMYTPPPFNKQCRSATIIRSFGCVSTLVNNMITYASPPLPPTMAATSAAKLCWWSLTHPCVWSFGSLTLVMQHILLSLLPSVCPATTVTRP